MSFLSTCAKLCTVKSVKVAHTVHSSWKHRYQLVNVVGVVAHWSFKMSEKW